MTTASTPSDDKDCLLLRAKPIRHIAFAVCVAACGATSSTGARTTVTMSTTPTHVAERRAGESPIVPPGIRAKLIAQHDGTRTYQLVLAPGTEAIEAITDFVLANHIPSAHFHGLGACTDAVLAYYDPVTHAYQKTVYNQQMEIVSFIGDAAPTSGDGAGLHVHMGVALRDGTMRGGHLFEAHVSPTMELELTADTVAVHRTHDETSNAWLLVP